MGLFTIWQGPENKECDSLKIQKRNEVLIGWSKDGFTWNRKNKSRFLPVSSDPNAWNAGNVQSTAGGPLIVGDSLYFYVSGRYNNKPRYDSNFSAGLAMIRRDGFTSIHANEGEGYILACEKMIDNQYLFVNIDVANEKGLFQCEILDEKYHPITGFEKENCVPLKAINSTYQIVTWKNGRSLKQHLGKKIHLKMYIRSGDLYSYWFSKDEKGKSYGYTSGGGPSLDSSGIDM